MPIRKFRDLDEMRRSLWCKELDQDCIRRIAALWARSSEMSPRVYPSGVFKFRNLEEAQAARERVTKENIERVLEARLLEAQSNPEAGSSWQEVKARLLSRK